MKIEELKTILNRFNPSFEVYLVVEEDEIPLDYVTWDTDKKDFSSTNGKVIFHG